MEYKQVKGPSLVTAAAVARFTSSTSFQLILFKQVAFEVWEFNGKKEKRVAEGALWWPVTKCGVLSSPISKEAEYPCNCTSEESHIQLDLLIVTNSEGKLSILEWDVRKGLKEVCQNMVSMGDAPTLDAMLADPVFSAPLSLPNLSDVFGSTEKSGQRKIFNYGGIYGNQKVKGSTLVAMSLFDGLIQILSAACVKSCEHTEISNNITYESKYLNRKFRSYFHLHFLQNIETNSLSIAGPHHSTSVTTIIGMAFLGASHNPQKFGSKALDYKARPLLAVLSQKKGVDKSPPSLQCLALDLSNGQLQSGPWKISNLHPTTSLVLPWCHNGGGSKSASSHNFGVIAVSSINILFCESSGQRDSIKLVLEGLPRSCDKLGETYLVIGDSNSTVHLIDLKTWHKCRVRRIIFNTPLSSVQFLHCVPLKLFKDTGMTTDDIQQMNNWDIIFTYCEGGDSHLLYVSLESLPKETCEVLEVEDIVLQKNIQESNNCLINTYGERRAYLPKDCIGANVEENRTNDLQQFQLESEAPVHDSILVHNPLWSSEKFILLACGKEPNGTVRRGNLAQRFHIDHCYTFQIQKKCDIPQLLPFKLGLRSFHDTHIVLSYEVEDVSETIEIETGRIEKERLQGFDEKHRTLAIENISDEWLVQITNVSLNVLNISRNGELQSEWRPNCSNIRDAVQDQTFSTSPRITMVSTLENQGVALGIGTMVVCLQLDEQGIPRVAGKTSQLHEVSALGLFNVDISKCHPVHNDTSTFVVLLAIAEWSSNTVRLLKWPNMENLANVDSVSSPIHSLAIAKIQDFTYLFIGGSDGQLQCLELAFIFREEFERSNYRTQIGRHLNSCECSNKISSSEVLCDGMWNSSLGFHIVIAKEKYVKLQGSIKSIIIGNLNWVPCLQSHSNNTEWGNVLIQTSNGAAIVFNNGELELQVTSVHGLDQSCVSAARVSSEFAPNSLVIMKRGQLVFGHLDNHPQMCWKISQVNGTPTHLSYHEKSGCAVVSSLEKHSSKIIFIDIQSMHQVLSWDLEESYSLTVLKTLKIQCKKEHILKEYVAAAVWTSSQSKGFIFFLDVSRFSPAKQEMKYQMQIVGGHQIFSPCTCLCLVKSRAKNASTDPHCYTQYREPMGSDVEGETMLALGSNMRVEIYNFFWSTTTLSVCLKDAVLRRLKKVLPIFFLGFEKEVDETLITSLLEKELCIELLGRQSIEESNLHEDLKLDMRRNFEFSSPGRSMVTDLASISLDTLIVSEMLHGVSIFRLQEDRVVQLSMQRFSHPVYALSQLSESLILTSIYSQGLQLLRRDCEAEVCYEIEQRRLQEMRDKAMNEEVEHIDTVEGLAAMLGDAETSDFAVGEMPGINISAFTHLPFAALKIQKGCLGFSTSYSTLEKCTSNKVKAVLVTPGGEIGVVTIHNNTS